MRTSGRQHTPLWDRRRLLGQLKAALALSWAVAVACKPEKKNVRSTEAPPQGGGPKPGGETPVTPTPNPGTPLACAATANRLDLSTFEKVEDTPTNHAYANLLPTMMFYGDTTSTMVVMALPKYQHSRLLEVYLVRPSGELIAQKGISEQADITETTAIRPLVFDNIQLKSDRRITVVFKIKCDACDGGINYVKYEMNESIAFADAFNGKPAYGCSPSLLSRTVAGQQAFATIGPGKADSFSDRNDGFKIATDESLFTGSVDLKSMIVTDLMGNVLAKKGEEFIDIYQHPQFICYKLVGDFYVRTIIRLV